MVLLRDIEFVVQIAFLAHCTRDDQTEIYHAQSAVVRGDHWLLQNHNYHHQQQYDYDDQQHEWCEAPINLHTLTARCGAIWCQPTTHGSGYRTSVSPFAPLRRRQAETERKREAKKSTPTDTLLTAGNRDERAKNFTHSSRPNSSEMFRDVTILPVRSLLLFFSTMFVSLYQAMYGWGVVSFFHTWHTCFRSACGMFYELFVRCPQEWWWYQPACLMSVFVGCVVTSCGILAME